MNKDSILLGKHHTSFQDIKQLLLQQMFIAVSEESLTAVELCRSYLDKKIEGGNDLFYGINTGFGYLQNVPIDKEQLEELQNNLLKSHACGMGEEVPAISLN